MWSYQTVSTKNKNAFRECNKIAAEDYVPTRPRPCVVLFRRTLTHSAMRPPELSMMAMRALRPNIVGMRNGVNSSKEKKQEVVRIGDCRYTVRKGLCSSARIDLIVFRMQLACGRKVCRGSYVRVVVDASAVGPN